MQRDKSRPFLEIFTLALNEDYRFPILEVFVFLFILVTFAFANLGAGLSGEDIAYNLTSSSLNPSLLVLMSLVFINLAYGLGSDIEKGIIQTYLSYPLKRHMILSAKLLSSIILPILILLSIQIPALYLLAPKIISEQINTVLLTYAAGLSPILLISGIILLITLLMKRGSLALASGITLYFMFSTISSMIMFTALATKSSITLKLLSIFYPNAALNLYYGIQAYPEAIKVWSPTFLEVAEYIGVSYLIAVSIFVVAYTYFCRRFGI